MELDTEVPSVGTFRTRYGSDDFPTLVEFARTAALRIEAPSSLRIFDQSAVLFTAEGPARVIVDAIDSWHAENSPLCPECGELLHAAQVAARPGWYCHGCGYRAAGSPPSVS
ncbi:hypothetical protein [Nocardia abscessus]|uniref:hypothetical protein n=1 Tax=Nocardia abscessus TaxID=120957 RepID=UPI002455BC5A|nr:hypothetical protein [Nocardia abscessus]